MLAISTGVVIITWKIECLEKVLAMKDAVDAMYVGEHEYTDSCSMRVRYVKDFTRPIIWASSPPLF